MFLFPFFLLLLKLLLILLSLILISATKLKHHFQTKKFFQRNFAFFFKFFFQQNSNKFQIMANFQKIKQIAKDKGITLGYLCKAVGITPQALSHIMRENVTTIDTMERIASTLGVSVSVFFDDTPSVSVSSVGDGNNIVGRGNIENARDIGKALSLLETELKEKNTLISELVQRIPKQP